MIKYVEVKLEPTMKALRLVLALKAIPSGKLVEYASYKGSTLALLIFEFLYK